MGCCSSNGLFDMFCFGCAMGILQCLIIHEGELYIISFMEKRLNDLKLLYIDYNIMEPVDLNYGQIFFMLLGFLPVLACVPCWVVAKFVYEPYVKKLAKEDEEPIPYEYQYPLENAENNGDGDGDYKKRIVLSNTPKGLVYMRYCKEDEGFEYWADNSIDYKYLETTARKYVTIFSCRDIYIDRFALLKEKLLDIKQQIEKNKSKEKELEVEEAEEEENDVFASFKSYNQSTSNISSTKTELTRNDVVCDKANKYLNRGKIAEADFGTEKKIVDTPTSSMSFSSWKLWKSQNKED